MEIFLRWLKIKIHWCILFVFVVCFVVFSGLHFGIDPAPHPRLSSFVGGLAAAFFVAILQFGLQLADQITLSKFRRQGVLEFLEDRRDRKWYGKLIDSATSGSTIQVLGVTCNRMLADFANYDDKHAQRLIRALENNVKVQILIPKLKYLSEKQCSDFNLKTLELAEKLKQKHSNNFHIKYFDGPPSHSMFVCGAKCLIGPVFEGKDSKDTPAIVFDRYGSFVELYIQNFNNIWDRSYDDYS